jgi:outer membrane receptor protein involved in Fe transport
VVNGGYVFKNIKPELGYGFMYAVNTFDYQQTYYDLYGLGYVDPNNPYDYINENNSTQYELNDPASYVENTTMINSLYYKNEINVKKLVINVGSRFENAYQYLSYRDQLQPSVQREIMKDDYEFLPFLNMKYSQSDKLQFRFNTSKTLVRPRFRELTPFLYTEVFAGSKIQGNPNLLNTDIYNGDIGFELYPKSGEVISLNLYGKYLINPIERVNVATASGRLETYQNSESASVIGGELDIKKKFGKFSVDYNLSLLWSQIQINDNGSSSVIVTNTERQLQGASNVLSNLDVFYNITDSINVGITYNYIGRKIESVGIAGLGDIYLEPLHLLNLVGNAQIGNFKITGRINNILMTPYVRTQMADDGLHIVGDYRLGVFYSLGVSYKF